MTSIGKSNTLRITSSAAKGRTICLVLTDSLHVDDDAIVLVYRDGENPTWSRHLLDFDVVDVCSTPPSASVSEFVCVASSGEAIFVLPDPVVERINEVGNYERIGTGTGMLSAIRPIDGRLVAMGRGGQVYGRTDAGAWSRLATTYPIEEHADDHINLSTGAKGLSNGTLAFGGMSVPNTDDGGERARLLIAGDMDAYKRALRKIRRYYGTLWVLAQGGWTKLQLQSDAPVTDTIHVPKHGLYVSTSAGAVYRIESEDEIETIYSNSSPTDIPDLSTWEGRLIIVHSGALVAHGFAPDSDVTIDTPPDFQMMMDLHSNEHATWLVDARGFAKWTGDGWQEIRIPAALMR